MTENQNNSLTFGFLEFNNIRTSPNSSGLAFPFQCLNFIFLVAQLDEECNLKLVFVVGNFKRGCIVILTVELVVAATEIVVLATALFTCVTTVAASSCCAYICSRNHLYTVELLKGKKRQLVGLIDDLRQRENGEAVVTPELACFIRNTGVYLAQVKETIVQIDKGIDDRCMSGILPNLWAQKQARARMEKTFMELEHLIEAGEDMSRKPVKGYKQPREVDIVGMKRKGARDEIWHQVVVTGDQQAAGVICIHGGVGVGKTSIAKYIHNKALNDAETFDYVIWVNVQYGEDQIWQVQEDIADRLDINLSPQDDVAARAVEESRKRAVVLRRHLLQKGKFLLVLDSMRPPLMSLDEIGIPELVGGKKLILTSRTNTICNRMERSVKYEIEALSNVDEAWELFKNEMGSSLPHYLEEETISSIKRASLVELDGLPFAISKLAQVLGNTQENAELNSVWKRELKVLAKKPFNYVDSTGFRDSYEDLEEAIKPCFLYCALFPKNHIIDNKELIEYWIWEGLLGENNKTLEERMEKGVEMLNQLKNAHMLQTQSGGERVKMLSLVRSMAINTMGKQGCIQSGGFLTSLWLLFRHDEWNSELERASFMENQLTDLRLKESVICRKLTCLFLQDNPFASGIGEQFFDCTPNLRVLDLSRTFSFTLPNSLSQLRNLHALLLRKCPNLSSVPNLSNLQQLIVLDVSGTPIKQCPQGILKMKKLRRLNLSETKIDSFPANVVGYYLKELEELLMIMGHDGDYAWGSNELENWQGMCIEDLLKLDHIAVLEINFLNTQVFDEYIKKAVQENKMPQKFRFYVGGFQSGRHVLGDNGVTIIGSHRFTPPSKMFELQLIKCSEKNWVLELGSHRWSNLRLLYVSTLTGASYLFSVEMFQSLDKLTELHVRKCKKMVALVKPEEIDSPQTINLPRLIKVVLFDLPKLNSICGNIELVCPSLRSLDISRCENLKHFHGMEINSESYHVSLDTTNLDFRGHTLQNVEPPSNAEASLSCSAHIYPGQVAKFRMAHLKERKLALFKLIGLVRQRMEEAVSTMDVPGFLRNADEYLMEVDMLIEDVEKGIDERCMSGLLPNVYARKLARTSMEEMLEQLNILIDEGVDIVQSPVKGYKQPRDVAIVGTRRIEIAQEILNILGVSDASDHKGEAAAIGAICMHGVLGVGKTSIAKYVHNKALENKAGFDYVIWVSVEYGAGLQQVQEVIANSLGIDFNRTVTGSCGDTVKRRARILKQALLKKDRFLLVVDSIWQPLCLDDIGIPKLVGGRKLMVTSRIRTVFSKIHASKRIFEVQPLLSVDESWELFKKEMGSYHAPCLESDEMVRDNLQKVLFNQLDGLPLAINELADTYLSEEIVLEDSAQPSFHMELRGTELFQRFNDSYENLEEVTRNCFVHMALLPKENEIQSKELIEYWMWEGLLGDSFETLEEEMEKGRQTLNELKSSHLLESVTTEVSDHKVKMLNSIRSMAIETMMNNAEISVFIRSAASLTRFPLDYEWPPEVEKASFTQNQISELRLTKRPKLNRLSTLLLQHNYLNVSNDQYFFYSMPNLKFLDMSRTSISLMPASLSSLKNLQILVLRSCANLTVLPDLSNLRDLVVFDVSGTSLKHFPLGIGNMKKLRRMDLSQTRLAKCPPKVIGQLAELEELLMITKNSCKWGSQVHDNWVEACVEELVGLGKLAVLELHFFDASAFLMYVKKAEESTNLPPKFRFCVGQLQNVTWGGQNSAAVSGCSEIMLPNNTLELHMMMCDSKLTFRGGLRDLDFLDVSNCDGLLYLFSADILGSLKNLRILKVRSCKMMEKVVQPDAVDCSTKIFLPALTTMVFFNLPKLKSVCCGQVLDCPRLSLVQVWSCEELRFPMIMIGPNRPQIDIQGDPSWFDTSFWDNPRNSNPLFQDRPHSNTSLRFVQAAVPPEWPPQEEKKEQEQGGSSGSTSWSSRLLAAGKRQLTPK